MQILELLAGRASEFRVDQGKLWREWLVDPIRPTGSVHRADDYRTSRLICNADKPSRTGRAI
jgi:hypothetical protein